MWSSTGWGVDRNGLARMFAKLTDLGVCDGEKRLGCRSRVRTFVNGKREEDLGRRASLRWGCGLVCVSRLDWLVCVSGCGVLSRVGMKGRLVGLGDQAEAERGLVVVRLG